MAEHDFPLSEHRTANFKKIKRAVLHSKTKSKKTLVTNIFFKRKNPNKSVKNYFLFFLEKDQRTFFLQRNEKICNNIK